MNIVNIDDTDRSILRYVMVDPRTTIADMARELGVQRDTVKYRLERMEKRGLIMKYHTIVDPEKLGLGVFMQVLVKTAPVPKEELGIFIEKVVEHKHVTHVSRLVGKHDYLLQMAATDIVDFDTALDQIKAMQPGVIAEIELSNIIDGLKTDDFSGLI